MISLLLADVLPLEDPAVYASLYDMTSPERRRAADSFRFMKDRMLSVGASALLDTGLRKFGLREQDMIYGRSEHGKPFFLNAPDIHFNISHSATKVAVAFSDREVGCDIEEAFCARLSGQSVEREAAKCLEMAGRFFRQEAYLAIKAIENPPERIRVFYRCWTLKESYMKTTGLGMTMAPDSFSVAALCTCESGSLSPKVVDGFVFYTFDSFEGYECALCSKPEAGPPEVRIVTLCSP